MYRHDAYLYILRIPYPRVSDGLLNRFLSFIGLKRFMNHPMNHLVIESYTHFCIKIREKKFKFFILEQIDLQIVGFYNC